MSKTKDLLQIHLAKNTKARALPAPGCKDNCGAGGILFARREKAGGRKGDLMNRKGLISPDRTLCLAIEGRDR
jgi:hypothetical protein